MARMIPDISPESITNLGERAVYVELRDQLPKKWVVRHHFPFCSEGEFLQDKEADFIVLAPERGVLVLEVKGSQGYESSDGIWYRINKDGTRMPTRNPFDQAMCTKHKLVDWLAWRAYGVSKFDFPGIFGHLVVYPFGKIVNAVGPSAEPAIMINYADMDSLHERLEKAFQMWGTLERAQQFTPEAMNKSERCIADDAKLVPMLSANAKQDNRTIEALTKAQFAAFRGVMGNNKVHVRGGAGSGKTLLALWAAKALAAKGQRVLFICYNRVLASWLKRKEGSSTISIYSFHILARETVLKALIPFDVPNENDREARRNFFEAEAPALFSQAIDALDEQNLPRYDVVVIDEAQDFHRDWWFPIQLLLKDPDQGRMFIFSDPDQSGVYGHEAGYPAPMTEYELQENCRNSRKIAQYCGKILNLGVECFPTSPVGTLPQVLEVTETAFARAVLVRKALVDLMAQGFKASQIAVLSPYGRSSPESALSHIPVVNMKALRGEDSDLAAWVAGRIIWASSIASFKGLEADCVIITDIPNAQDGGQFTLADAYVAGSRAIHQLIIAPCNGSAETQQRSWTIGINTE